MSTIAGPRPDITRAAKPSPGPVDYLKKFPQAFASLRLTVVLMALSVVLVFIGTIAQKDDSIHTVLNKYFYTWIAWVPFQVFVRFAQNFFGLDNKVVVSGGFPFPGGWILGFLLMINLTAAHAVRFKLSWKRSGIWLIHIGTMLLLLGEFLSSQFKIESKMIIDEGAATNWVFNENDFELAFVDSSDSKEDQVMVVPDQILRKGGRVSDPTLPVDFEVLTYIPISEEIKQPLLEPRATKGTGLRKGAVKRREVPGVSQNQEIDIPSAYVRFIERGTNADLGTYMLFGRGGEQALDVGGKTYGVSLRNTRRYFPFSLHLIDFRFDRFVGTNTARNFSSDVRLSDSERSHERTLRIAMNEPLRYRGETFYQASWDEATEAATVLQVVRNPAWTAPYLACTLVCLGMLVHFGIGLSGFLGKQVAR